MELSKQVVSLELAKRLKELGVKQESYFCWAHKTAGVHKSFDGGKTEYVEDFSDECELGESDSASWDGVPKYIMYPENWTGDEDRMLCQ